MLLFETGEALFIILSHSAACLNW